MRKKFFRVGYGETHSIRAVSSPATLVFPLEGFASTVKKKESVVRGDVIASAPNATYIYAPCDGVVTAVTENAITIEKGTVEKEPRVPISIQSLPIEEQCAMLAELGFTKIRSLPKLQITIVINALYTDLGLSYIPALFTEELAVLEKGIECLRELFPAVQIVMAMPTDSTYSLRGMENVYIEPMYPHTIDELVLARITGKENPHGVSCLQLLDIWHIGKLVMEGLPLSESILTVNEYTVKAMVGHPIEALLEECGLPVESGDAVIMNGLLRGYPLARIDTGILPSVFSLHRMKKETFPVVAEDPCVSCGACTAVCPARLRVHLLNQYAERSEFELCEEEHIFACFECGLCDYVCLAKRPLLQYLRYAKHNTVKLLPMAN